MRRSTVLLLTLCLSLVTSIALLAAAGAALPTARAHVPIADRTAKHAELAGQFYAAVDDAIRTGNADALDAIVAPGFVWCHPCPGQAPGRDGFKRHLVGLHQTAPEARLVAEAVAAVSPDTVTARVRMSGHPLVSDPAPWGPIETLRVAGGLVAERRAGPEGMALVDPLLRARLGPLPPAVTGLALARLTFPVGAGVAGLLSAGPTLLVVEAGALAVHVAADTTIVRAGVEAEVGSTAGTGAGVDTVLYPGDAAIIPAGVRHAFRQRGEAPAVALGFTLVFATGGGDHPQPRGPEFAPFSPPDRSAGESLPLPDVRPLAAGAVEAWPTGAVRVAVGRMVLGAGARVASPASEATLLAVEAGTLGVAGGEERTVPAGGGVLQPAGAARELRNAGDGLLVLLVVTVAAANG